ncbi:MAG: hypothetical protein ACE5NG_20300 [bacterium]
MKPVLIAGSIIVTFALVSYTIAIFTEQKKGLITNKVLIFLTLGICLDITSTGCMITGSENPAFTLHGIFGYSSLTAMLIDTILIWKVRTTNGINAKVPKHLHLYSRLAYSWWVVAFITGGLLVAMT